MDNNKFDRMYELDVLRGIAVLAVVLFHYSTRYEDLFGHVKETFFFDFKYGFFGVQLFFIISGFVIYMTIMKCKNVKEFAFKRITRLYPAYIFSVIITYIIVTTYHLEGREVSLLEAIFNLTMLQGYIPFIGHVDGAYWSLTVEMSFYFIFGFLLFSGMIKKIELVSIAWLIIASIFNVFDLNKYIQFIVFKIGIFDYCNLFIAGIMFYQLKNVNKLKYHLIIGLTLVFEFVFNDIINGLFVMSFFLMFYALIFNKLKFLNIKILKYLGTISYSLYLIHQNIGYVIINYLEKKGFISEFYLLIPLLLSILIASIITFYIEKPLQKYLRKYISYKNVRESKYYKDTLA